ncbi:Rrf2 family transcriptional regulator [Clostridium estertheticum]|uniref:Rrf2 family transcriptional regulator n=1 Tax=Clostridium estertheticum TaxID=238834 RepID=UPI001C0D6B9A|nr:Rrf2 family transcriptional regulator [Clostridium estertheticum]MBU3215033.1 Rrf2 family transcriptional regulator [Clostridium estertheticum]WAG55676.1 Rrf2 family transcriptional regulator [Clostridium estertheticum]
MKISSRFTVAVHILSLLSIYPNPLQTSDMIAGSVNTNAVVIRRILGMLKSAGLVDMKRGTGGSYLTKHIEDINLLEVYKAVDVVDTGGLFQVHQNPNINCPIGANIQSVIEVTLFNAQESMENVLKNVTMLDVVSDFNKKLNK